MMKPDVFCVGCGKMVADHPGTMLFRTAFYKVIHPAGCCEPCLLRKMKPEVDNLVNLPTAGKRSSQYEDLNESLLSTACL